MKKQGKIQTKRFLQEEILGTLFSMIPLVGFALFSFVPLLMAIATSFAETSGLSLEGAKLATDNGKYFLPIANFITVVSDSIFWQAMGNTFYMALQLPIGLIVSVVIAELLSKNLKGTKIFKTIFFIPYICSIVATTIMWKWVFNTNYGVINQILGTQTAWLSDDVYYIPVIIFITVWSTIGYRVLLLTAAITNVQKTLVESAQLDGAGPISVFWHITLPAISPTLFYLLVMGLINALQEFTRSQVIDSQGGPNGVGLTMVFYIYREAFSYINMGVANAASVILSILILVLTKISFKLSDKWVSYD